MTTVSSTTPEAEKGAFDIVVIDGYAQDRMRHRRARSALTLLRSGGFIILDNSDWLPATCRHLRHHDLIQMDFSGFVRGKSHTPTTSFFLTRDFRVPPVSLSPIGGTRYNWEPLLDKALILEGSPKMRLGDRRAIRSGNY